MHDALILMLPGASAATLGAVRHWWRVADGKVIDSGVEGAWHEAHRDATPIIALAPVEDVPVEWRAFPKLTSPQAMAAARLQAAEHALGDTATLHVAAGVPTDDAMVPTAAVSRAAMDRWLALLAGQEVAVSAIVPVAALVPIGAVRQAIRTEIGDAVILTAGTLSAASDPAIDMLRVGGLELVEADVAERTAWIAGLADTIPINLLTGDFAPRRGAVMSTERLRWVVRLAALLFILTVAVPLAQAWQRSQSIDAADVRALTAAKAAGVEGNDVAAVEADIDRRLAARGGGPLALSAPLGGLYQSLSAHTAVAVRTLSHINNGTLTVTLASPRVDDVNAVLKDLQARGFVITAQPLSGSDGMQMATVTIRAIP